MIELSQAPASLPSGRRIYALGDIHGCARQLANLHATIAGDLAARPIETALLLHIGDYVDRGADTAGVIRMLLEGCPIAGMEMVNLMGNHESTMLDALSGERAAGTDWLFAGGKAALGSGALLMRSSRRSSTNRRSITLMKTVPPSSVLAAGAQQYTERLGQECLLPWLRAAADRTRPTTRAARE